MNSFTIKYILLFFALVLFQVMILDHVNFLGYINPYFYLAFIIFLPLKLKSQYTIILGFLLGLCIDIFNNTGGVHAGACVAVAYLKPIIIRLTFGINYDFNTIKLETSKLNTQISFILSMVFVHHLIMFSLAYFSLNHIVEILRNTIFSGLFTSLLIFITLKLSQK